MPKKEYKNNLKKSQNYKKMTQQNDQKFHDVTFTPLTKQYYERLERDIQYFKKKVLYNWSFMSHNYEFLQNQSEILYNYIKNHHQYTEMDQFDSSFNLLPSLNINFQRVNNVQLLYKSFNLFQKNRWPVRFSSKFVSKVSEYSTRQIKYILSAIMYLADGHFVGKQHSKEKFLYVKPIEIKCIPYNRFFNFKIYREKNILVHIGVEKVPIVSKGIIKRYQYRNYLHFLDIITDSILQNNTKLQQRIKTFLEKIQQDVAKKDHSQDIQIDVSKCFKNNLYFFVVEINPYNDIKQVFEKDFKNNNKADQIWHPLPFKVQYVSLVQNNTLVFDNQLKRWISQDFLNRVQRKKLNDFQRKVNEQLVKRFIDFQSAKTLVQLLTKIPNFKVNLTQQQKDVIGQNGNIMVIGRSGTGKTTCAVMRLFSIEMLFKIRLSLYKKKFQSEIKDTRCSSDDIDKAIGLHCIFLTASPVLTNQIQRYYQKLTKNIKEQLQKKRKKVLQERLQKQKQEKNNMKEINEDSIQQIKAVEIQQSKNQEDSFYEIPETIKKTKSKQVMEEQSQMNQNLKGIQLKQNVYNEQFNEDQEDFDKVKEQFQNKIKKFQSLDDLQQTDYPGFFTVKSYIMMIDGVLQKPFFIRNKNIDNMNEQTIASWHNQRKGVMTILNYYLNNAEDIDEEALQTIQEQINYSDQEQLQHQYMRQIQLKNNKQKQNLTKKLASKKKKNQLSFQVDYEYFLLYFWPQVYKNFYSSRNITPQLVWTEIYSTIKGSASSHLYPGQYLPQKVYISQSTNVFLTIPQKQDIYSTFCHYERWKIQQGGYDLIDTVNYVLNSIRMKGYNGPQIHYVMIDQVQDLPHAIIYLLSKTASYGVFYSGDTAQTIAKGVGFRFCDLKSLFDPRQFDSSLKMKKPVVKHLTVNFRSHNNILQLANSIVSCLQILFPKTIDKLAKERSDLNGPKPIILASGNQELLFQVLCGQQTQKQTQYNGMKKPPLQFGCDQVIIVRDQNSKQKVPKMLQHALCLTIYQAKGLQFNDVILFNFFTECQNPQKWTLLKYLKVIEEQISKQEYLKNLTKHQTQDKEQADQNKQNQNQKITENQQLVIQQFVVQEKNETVKIKKIISDVKKIMKDINDYVQLCSDLKLFYTAITRPRKNLIIYDQNPTGRAFIQKIWENLGIIQLVSKQLIEQQSVQNKSNVFRRVVTATDKKQWKKQGLKMYARGYFQQAMKCFEKSQNQQLFKKAQANLYADKATKLLIEVQSVRTHIKQGLMGYKNMSNSDLKQLKKKLKQDEKYSYQEFNKSAQIFNELRMFKQAGQCYFSGKQFEKAKQSFLKISMKKQAAECYQMMQKYREAAQLYDQEGQYLKVIECFDMINQWQQILKRIKNNQNKMTEIQRSSLIKKYSALALEALVIQIQFQNDQQKKDDVQNVQNNRIQIIQQKQSDQEEDFSEQQIKQKIQSGVNQQQLVQKNDIVIQEIKIKQHNYKNEKGQINQELSKNKQNQQSQSLSFADLNGSNSGFQEIKAQSQNSFVQIEKQKTKQKIVFQQLNRIQIKQQESNQSLSFADLNGSQDFSQVNIKYEKQFQPQIESIRSLADPEDPWIKSALSQISPKSQYSILDESQNYNMNIKIIKTKGNIFIQDKIMQKIIRIVSIINQSTTSFFKQFKGYQSLITINKSATQEQIQNNDNISQFEYFEDIDSQTINIILDTLQSFKLYKLCLFVCNRYHLPQKAGRYLISIMMKYSTNCQSNTFINSGLLAPSTQRKNQLQKGILGSIVVHSILENVNSEFLKIKINGQKIQKNTLGLYFIQGLILQGFYKKSVFMIDIEQSLKVLDNFCDYDTFKQVYKNKFIKTSSSDKQLFFSLELTTKQIQTFYNLILLYDVMRKYQIINRFQVISVRYYKQYDRFIYESIIENLQIPNYLPFTNKFIKKDLINIGEFLDKHLPNSYKYIQNGNILQCTDTVFGILSILYDKRLEQKIIYQAKLNSFIYFYECLKIIKDSLYKIEGGNCLQIIKTILIFYQCKLIQNCKSMNMIGSNYCFIHRTSVLANELIQQSKNNPNYFAYFIEQDYNLIIVKLCQVVKFIKKKFMIKVSQLLNKRCDIIRFKKQILPDDYKLCNQQRILIQALNQALNSQIFPQNKISKKRVTNEIIKKNLKVKPNFDYKTQGKFQHAYIIEQDISQDQFDESQLKNSLYKYVLPDFTNDLKPLSQQLLKIFQKKTKQSTNIIIGKQLYCANLNNYYRQYVQKKGGFVLYDAIQFKKFKRLDLYAENIYQIINSLSLIDKHVYLSEMLILLMIQVKRLTNKSNKHNFVIQMETSYLKYFDNLKIIQQIQQKNNILLNASDDLHQSILIGNKFLFSYHFQYTSDLNLKQLSELVYDYLNILQEQGKSQYADLSNICMLYLINIQPDNIIYEKIRSILKFMGGKWQNNFYQQFIKCKNQQQFIEARTIAIKYYNPFHKINISFIGNLQKSIQQSQKDYNQQTQQINHRKNAVNKIIKWWKKYKISKKLKNQKNIHNYFDYILNIQNNYQIKKQIKYLQLYDFRILELIQNCNLTLKIPLILKIQNIRQQLLKFYLKNIIVSSLDLHYLLISLRKIQEYKQQYIKFCRQLQNGFIDADFDIQVNNLEQSVIQLQKNIDIWKNDQKWLKEKDINLKKKKIFEVKWMTKSINQMKLIKRRANLKKQQKLQQKKKFIKN